jgi:subtilisin-like proprotein convertase family protein
MKKIPLLLGLLLSITVIGKAQSCQPFTIRLNSELASHPILEMNEIQICLNDTLSLGVIADFPNNNVSYQQTQSNTKFIWKFEMMEQDTANVIYKHFNQKTIKNFNLRAVDVNGCSSSNQINGKILVSGNPIISIDSSIIAPINTEIFLNAGQETNSTLVFQPIEIPLPPIPSSYYNYDTVFLPDGNNICYNNDITILNFDNDQVLNSLQLLKGIVINMEHTYLEDLSIRITCPSGQMAVLKTYNGTIPAMSPGGIVANACSSYGGGINLGCPVDAPSNNLCYLAPGVGFDYEFKPGATGCFGLGGSSVESSFTDPCGTNWTLPSLKPSTSNNYTTTPSTPIFYGSYQNLSALIGCPLNGNWRITVCDHVTYDNGFIFNWGIKFDESLQANPNPYIVGIDSVTWNGPNLTINTPFSATAYHNSAGIFNYTASVHDHFGCIYNAPFTINTAVTIEDFSTEPSYIKIYPNPTKGFIHISNEKEAIKMVQLYSINGKLLLEQNGDSFSIDIDLNNYQSGVYICKVITANGDSKYAKVIKK